MPETKPTQTKTDPLADLTVIPDGWRLIQAQESKDGVGARYMDDNFGLRVIRTKAQYGRDKKWWVHVSVSLPDRLPSWSDLKRVKTAFLGDRLAVQVFPPESQWVNVHPYCLHLWHCLNGDPVPDFRHKGAI